MNENELEARAASGEIAAPILPEKPAFRRELAAALLMYPAAFAYVRALDDWPFWPFLLLFVGLTELLCREKPRSRESWFWLGCMLLCWWGSHGRVWGDEVWLPLHALAIWWVLHRSGALLEHQSGHLLPLDMLNGAFVFPFRHFLLRLHCLAGGLGKLLRRQGNSRVPALSAALAAASSLLLFALALRFLQAADSAFERLVTAALGWLKLPEWRLRWFDFVLSLPVGAYLFGLIAGSCREERRVLDERAERACRRLAGLRRVPHRVWLVLAAGFVLLYLLFFAVQARYLFGAFSRRLPEGFIVSEYARRGFFELCRVMALNFALLWLVTRTADRSAREDRALRLLCLLLLAESLLFAVIAASKLGLYIDCFGFTPRRIQSLWLVCTLGFGCLCSLRSLMTQRPGLRFFLVAAALSFVLLGLY